MAAPAFCSQTKMGAHEELEAANAMGLEVLAKLFSEPSEVGTRFEGRLAPGFLVRPQVPPPARILSAQLTP
jgi:hypothetical protein